MAYRAVACKSVSVIILKRVRLINNLLPRMLSGGRIMADSRCLAQHSQGREINGGKCFHSCLRELSKSRNGVQFFRTLHSIKSREVLPTLLGLLWEFGSSSFTGVP